MKLSTFGKFIYSETIYGPKPKQATIDGTTKPDSQVRQQIILNSFKNLSPLNFKKPGQIISSGSEKGPIVGKSLGPLVLLSK